MWGFSHGASRPSGTSSGIANDPGTSDTIGGLGGVLGNAPRSGELTSFVWEVGEGPSGVLRPSLPTLAFSLWYPGYRYLAAEVPVPLVG